MNRGITNTLLVAAASFFLAACTKVDVVDILSISDPIVYKVDGVADTKAYLVTNDNVAEKYPEMTVKAVRRNTSDTNDDVCFTDSFSTSSTGSSSLEQTWSEDSYVFYSYPSSVGITPGFSNNAMVFTQTISTDSQSTPDIVIARTEQTRGNDVSFTYKHIFTAVNVVYKKVSIGHKITKVSVKNTPTSGKCTISGSGTVNWENQAQYKDLVDETKRYAINNDHVLTEDGCKFMTIPGQEITIEVVIDGITLTKTCPAKNAGDIVTFYIEDDIETSEEEGSETEGEVVKNPDGTYKITLGSYVTGAYKTTVTAKPMDFILVLDYSSSMTNSYSDSNNPKYTPATVKKYSFNNWKSNKTKYKATLNGVQYTVQCLDLKNSGTDNIHWAYIEANSKRYYITLDGCLHESTNTSPSMANIPVDTEGVKIFPTVGGAPSLWGEVTFGAKDNVNNRIKALMAAVSDFADLVASDAKANGVTHRISVIEFQNPKFPTFTGQSSGRKNYIDNTSNDYLRQCFAEKSDNQNKQTTAVLFPFRTADENTATAIKGAIALTGVEGCTAIDYGMYLASLQVANCREGAGKTVVVFTDGKPTHAGNVLGGDYQIPGYTSSGETKTDAQVADGAVKFAKSCKDQGAKVYSIGVFSSSDKPGDGFMDAISSNYDKATSVSSRGTQTGTGYYMDATSSSLTSAFQTVATSSIETAVDIHKDAYVTAVISDAFQLPADYIEDSENIHFYECAQTGYDSSTKKIIWSTSMTDITSQITCELDHSKQLLKIKGFDYGSNACIADPAGPFNGKKLVMEFDCLVSNPERDGTGMNHAIDYTTGLYDDKGNPVSMFDTIYINL